MMRSFRLLFLCWLLLATTSLSVRSQEEPVETGLVMQHLTERALLKPKLMEGHWVDFTHMLIDAYHLTHREYFYRTAQRVAQRPEVKADATVLLRLFEEKRDSSYWRAVPKAIQADTVCSYDMFYRTEYYYQLTANSRYLDRMQATIDTLVAHQAIDEATRQELLDVHAHAKRMSRDDLRRNSPFQKKQASLRPYYFLGRNLGEEYPQYLRSMSLLLHRKKQSTRTLSGLYPDNFKATVAGKPTALYRLVNKEGVEACFTNYGARLVSLIIPDRDGNMEDIVLGFDNIDSYHQDKQNFGANVGRYAGRITGAKFTLDGQTFQLQADSKGNISHGGYPGLADQVWSLVSQTSHTLVFQVVSPDGENGFPGLLTVTLAVTLTDDNSLQLNYEAETTQPTVLNLTHHSFFNLSGKLYTDVLDQQLLIAADSIAEYAPTKNLTGRLLPVAGTPFDFRSMRQIGDSIDSPCAQLRVTGGYDHSWALYQHRQPTSFVAQLYHPLSGRQMTVYTTEPAAHLYMANGLKGLLTGKFAIRYPARSAVCVETMHFADSPNKPQFPSTVLRPGTTFRSQTVYRFSVQ